MLQTNQMLRFQPGKTAVCALIQCGGLFLGVTRKDNSNDYGLPGGKVDANETLEQALIREVLEETGYHITVDADKPYFVNGDTAGYTVYTFICSFASQARQQVSEDETGVVQFVNQEQLTTLSSFALYNSDLFTWLNKHG